MGFGQNKRNRSRISPKYCKRQHGHDNSHHISILLKYGAEEILFEEPDGEEPDVWIDPEANSAIRIAIVGRPNMGKSTLVNTLVGESRLLTGPEAGITRDSITLPFRWENRDYQLVDTAGIRRQARVIDKVEKLMVNDAERAIQFAKICVLMLPSNT